MTEPQPWLDWSVPNRRVDRPLDRGRPLRGCDLRHALLVLLLRRGTVTIDEALAMLAAAGFEVHGRYPRKVVADAFGCEVVRRRARRIGRGRFALGSVPRSTAYRVRSRWDRAP